MGFGRHHCTLLDRLYRFPASLFRALATFNVIIELSNIKGRGLYNTEEDYARQWGVRGVLLDVDDVIEEINEARRDKTADLNVAFKWLMFGPLNTTPDYPSMPLEGPPKIVHPGNRHKCTRYADMSFVSRYRGEERTEWRMDVEEESGLMCAYQEKIDRVKNGLLPKFVKMELKLAGDVGKNRSYIDRSREGRDYDD